MLHPPSSLGYAESSGEVDWQMAKAKKSVFSATKAVKANARERLGTPPPSRPLPDPKQKATAKPKHKETLADLLKRQED
jgi:hypothetical protein